MTLDKILNSTTTQSLIKNKEFVKDIGVLNEIFTDLNNYQPEMSRYSKLKVYATIRKELMRQYDISHYTIFESAVQRLNNK